MSKCPYCAYTITWTSEQFHSPIKIPQPELGGLYAYGMRNTDTRKQIAIDGIKTQPWWDK